MKGRNSIKALYWGTWAGIYLAGLWALNTWVRLSCSSASCIHGWDSQETLLQRTWTIAFLIVVPILAYAVSRRIWGRDRTIEKLRSHINNQLGHIILEAIRRLFR